MRNRPQVAARATLRYQRTVSSPRARLVLALLSITGASCHRRARAPAQTWRWESPQPQGNRLNAVCLDDAGSAYAVGTFGTILVRPRGGAWSPRVTSSDATLHAVSCGASGVWAVGERGVVLRSRDRGASWQRVPAPARGALRAVTTAGRGVLVGGVDGVVLHARDGERFAASTGVGDAEVTALWSDGTTSIAVGRNGIVLRATDGGARWTRVESGTRRTLTGVWGSGPDDLYAVGAGGTILVSNDGGARWTVLPRMADDDLRAVVGRGRRDVYIVGTSAAVLHTRDGVQFLREDSGAPADLYGLAVRGDDVVAVGARGSITARDPGGRWRLLPGGHRGTLHAVWRGGGGFACAAGQGGAILCRDPALGWVPMPSGVRANLAGIASDGGDVFVAVGDYGTLLRSTDRGRTWGMLPTGEGGTLAPGDLSPTWAQLPTRENKVLTSVWMGPRGEGLIVGRDGIVLRSTDRGARWSRIPSGTTKGLSAVWSTGDGRAWACGGAGTLLRSEDGGAHWTAVALGTSADLFSVWSDGHDVWTVGRSGAMYRSTDGVGFTRVSAGITDTLLSISGNARGVWVASVSGHLFHSRPRGTHWALSPVRTDDDFNAVSAAPDGGVTVVGYWGTILTSP